MIAFTPRSTRVGRRHEDRGTALVLAIGFVVMIGLMGAALAALVSSSLNNRTSLEQVRNRQYAADGAIEMAIAAQASSPGSGCAAGAGAMTTRLNSFDIRVEWHNACGVVRRTDGLLYVQRNVVFAACADSSAACVEDAIVRAQVNFQQDASGAVIGTAVQSWSVER